MNSNSQFFRINKINVVDKGLNALLVALKHNKREYPSKENIDSTRTQFNYALAGEGSAKEINALAKTLRIEAGITTLRKNAVVAIEVLFSGPVRWHDQDTSSFFNDCRNWVARQIDGELLSFDVHLDEGAPHAHALILPIIDRKLNASKIVGDRANILRLTELFFTEVGNLHGLNRISARQTEKGSLEKLVLNLLADDPIVKSSMWPIVRDYIANDPSKFAEMLSVDMQISPNNAKVKSFVDYKRQRGKGTFIR